MLKTWFKKEEPKHFIYCYYKNFSDKHFCFDLKNTFWDVQNITKIKKKTFVNVSDAHAQRKTKVLRGNHKPHVDNNLRKDIMTLSKQIKTKFQDDFKSKFQQISKLLNLRNKDIW